MSFDELKVLRGIVYDELLGAEQQVFHIVTNVFSRLVI